VRWHQKKVLSLTAWPEEPTQPITPTENTEFKYLAKIEARRAAAAASASSSSSSAATEQQPFSDVKSVSVYANEESGISLHLRTKMINEAGTHAVKPTCDIHKTRILCCKTMQREYGYIYTTGKRENDFSLYEPKTDDMKEGRTRGSMIAKSLKNLLLYVARAKQAAMYTRVVELCPEFESLMLWQLERHRMDSGRIQLTTTTSNSSSVGVGWTMASSRTKRTRKKAKTFAEESGDQFMKEEEERERIRTLNRIKKLEKEKLEKEKEKEEKRKERELQRRIAQQKRLGM
jgi:hypothetical protein